MMIFAMKLTLQLPLVTIRQEISLQYQYNFKQISKEIK